jgi:hypothetical protein
MLLTAPLFSNPGPVAVLTGVLEVKKEIIDERADIYDLHEALGVLVGHGHYDHLMDVSYLTVTHAKSATIYGSRTVRNQIIAYPGLDHRRIQTIDQRAATVSRMGRWTSVGTRFRFMPVRSQYSLVAGCPHDPDGDRSEDGARLAGGGDVRLRDRCHESERPAADAHLLQ